MPRRFALLALALFFPLRLPAGETDAAGGTRRFRVYESEAYRIRTDAGEEAAGKVSAFMDSANDAYRRVLDAGEETPRLTIYAYRRHDDYAVVARGFGLDPNHIGGFYYGGVTHLLLRNRESLLAERVLLHEGAHHFLHTVLVYRPPEALRERLPGRPEQLAAIPFWLDEGVASYMEGSACVGVRVVPGKPSRMRLLRLQQELRAGRNVGLRDLLTTTRRSRLKSRVATAWGLVYWFLHDPNPVREKAKRKVFLQYIDACRGGFLDDPQTELPALAKDGRRAFARAWGRHVRERSYAVFLDLTVGDESGLAAWEDDWTAWILDLPDPGAVEPETLEELEHPVRLPGGVGLGVR